MQRFSDRTGPESIPCVIAFFIPPFDPVEAKNV